MYQIFNIDVRISLSVSRYNSDVKYKFHGFLSITPLLSQVEIMDSSLKNQKIFSIAPL